MSSTKLGWIAALAMGALGCAGTTSPEVGALRSPCSAGQVGRADCRAVEIVEVSSAAATPPVSAKERHRAESMASRNRTEHADAAPRARDAHPPPAPRERNPPPPRPH